MSSPSPTAKMKALISMLQSANALDAQRWVETITSGFIKYGTFSSLAKHMVEPASATKEYDGFVEGIREDSEQAKNLSVLALASIGKSLHQFNDRVEQFGFRKGVDKERCQAAIQGSLTGLLPLMLRCHIDEAIKQYNDTTQRNHQDPLGEKPVFLDSLESYVGDEEVLLEFSRIIFSKAFLDNEQFLETEDKTALSTNSWMNVLFVYLYLQQQGQFPAAAEKLGVFDGNSFDKVIDGQKKLLELQTWLDNNVSQSENEPYSATLLKLALVDRQGQSELDELQDRSTFIKDILGKAPLTNTYLPPHELDVTNLSSATYLAVRLPIWAWKVGLPLDLYVTLGAASQNFMQALSLNWNAFVEERFNRHLQSALEVYVSTPSQFSVRGRNAALPVTFNIQEYGSDIASDVSKLDDETGMHLFSLNRNDRLLYVEGTTETPILVNPFSSSDPSPHPLLPDNAKVMVIQHGRMEPRSEGTDYSGKGCFIPGTKIWTSGGETAIEDLRENDRILTFATSGEFGVKSDETVANPTGGRAILWGFNDEDVFFTAGHVFHTTTGHRAIDPVAAKQENPWLEVGKLRVGHTLLRTTDGETYEHVVIAHLHGQMKECDHVWGIHLREGLRSYHANGYLVRLNYPEITVKSVADIIKTLLPEQKMAVMLAIKDLKPIFDRFGSGTVEQLLKRELSDDDFLRKAKHKPQEDFDPQPLYFQSRSFDLDTYNGGLELPQGYNLPEIDALDGVLYINGDPIERSKIYESSFSWSRIIGDDLWEHGMCSFGRDKAMVSGDGQLWVDNEADPVGVSPNMIQFVASSTALRQRYTTGSTTPDGMSSITHTNQPAMVRNLFSLKKDKTRIKIGKDTSETEKLLLSEEDTSAWFATKEILDEKRIVADKVEGRPPRSPDHPLERQDLTWQLNYDRALYDEYEDPRNTIPYLKITRVFRSESGAHPTMTVKIPFLDKLAEGRRIATGSATQVAYYESGYTMKDDHRYDIWINITNGKAVALAADDNVDEDGDVKSYKNLTFKGAGFDEQLPFLFQRITARVGNIENTLKGKIAEYDELSSENLGEQHWILGSLEGSTVASPIIKTGGQSPAVLSPAQPASPTRPSFGQRFTSLINLGRGLGVNGELVKKQAQSYIYKTMLYHMADDDRNNFTHEGKPSTTGIDGLPAALAGDLQESLRNWLRKTYSRAYIANMMSQMSESDQKKYNMNFTEDDKKRLKYFWQGRGAGCLSRSNEYSELNTIANTIAFRKLYPAVKDYIEDDEAEDVFDENGKPLSQQSGGRKWAYKYFHALTTEDWVTEIAGQSGFQELTGRNPLEFHTTILCALWIEPLGAPMDGTGLAKILTEMVHRKIRDSSLFAYSLTVQGSDLITGMKDYMGPLIDLLMDDEKSKAAGIDPGVRRKLLKDMELLIDRQKILKEEIAKKNQQAYNRVIADSVRNSMVAVIGIKEGSSYTWKGAKSIFEFCRKLREKPPVGETGIELPPMGKKPLPEIPSRPPVTGNIPTKVEFGAKAVAVAGLLFSVFATVFYVWQTWDSWKRIDDPDTTGLERAELICTGLQTLGGLAVNACRSVELFKYGYKGRPKGAPSALVQEAEHAAASDFEKTVKRRQSWMNPRNQSMIDNPILHKRRATAPMKLAENTAKAASVNEQVLPKNPSRWQSIKGKMKFNVLETSIRLFAVGVSVALMTVSIITACQNYDDKWPLEQWLSFIGILIQAVSVIIEIAVLFTAVSPWFTIGIIVVGLIYQIVCSCTQKEKKPDDTPAQKWYKTDWEGFQKALPTLPPTRFKWSIEPKEATVGQDQTIAIIGKAAEPTENFAKNLSKIQLSFAISTKDGVGLFDSKSLTRASGSSLQNNEGSILYPDIFESYTKAYVTSSPPSPSGSIQVTATFTLRDAGDLYSQRIYKDNMPFLDKSLATGTEIKFLIRGKVNKRMRKPEGAKDEDAGIVPAWGKYHLKIEEYYTDDTGSVPEQIVEDELLFKKLM